MIKTIAETKKIPKVRSENGIETVYFEEESVLKFDSAICSECGKEFCSECQGGIKDIKGAEWVCPYCTVPVNEPEPEIEPGGSGNIDSVSEIGYIGGNGTGSLNPESSDRDVKKEKDIKRIIDSRSDGLKLSPWSSAPSLYKKFCKNCGDLIDNNAIEDSSSKCSMCKHDFCQSCLNLVIDDKSRKEYHFCSSCLNKYEMMLAERNGSNGLMSHLFVKKDKQKKTEKPDKPVNKRLLYTKIAIFLILTPILTLLLSGAIIMAVIPDLDSALASPQTADNVITKVTYMKRSGEPLVLTDNESAKNCSWYDLLIFLENDDTDELMYRNGTFVCTDFAERLHNNAEQAGIRAAFVIIDYSDEEIGHAINAFETTDMGLVFIDCTGSTEKNNGRINWDKMAYVKEGEKYAVVSLDYAKEAGYDFYETVKDNRRRAFFEEGGTVEKVDIYWSM
jgi:hypothetical protein